MVDPLFTNGVIAVKEKYLLKDKLVRMCEMTADDAFRALLESGFGGGEAASVYEYEKLVAADEREIDGFIREYAISRAELEYLLTPRDFHNAKAFVKAEALSSDAEKMLAPEGLVPLDVMRAAFSSGDFSKLGGELGTAVISARQYIEDGGSSGAEIGAIFERAQFKALAKACKRNGLLKGFVAAKADMTNILTALRSQDEGFAEKYYVEGGKLKNKQLSRLFLNADDAARAFEGSGYEDFVKICLEAKAAGQPLTEAERALASYESDELYKHAYELKRGQPFLYYVLRRRAENQNVRVVFACLTSGMSEKQIKRRLRGTRRAYDG